MGLKRTDTVLPVIGSIQGSFLTLEGLRKSPRTLLKKSRTKKIVTTDDNVVLAIVIPKDMRRDVFDYANEKQTTIQDWLLELIKDEMHK